MLEFLKPLKTEDHDAVFFLPGDKEGQIQIESATYKNRGENIGGSYLGHSYHVILFREDNEKDGIYGVDRFEAVFVDPLEYISDLIPQNWYGIIAKRTTTSNTFIQNVFDKLQKV
jgi:hypothetical protein